MPVADWSINIRALSQLIAQVVEISNHTDVRGTEIPANHTTEMTKLTVHQFGSGGKPVQVSRYLRSGPQSLTRFTNPVDSPLDERGSTSALRKLNFD